MRKENLLKPIIIVGSLGCLSLGVLASGNAPIKTSGLKEGEAFSFVVVGDPQCVNKNNPTEFHKIYDYIVENAEERNTKFVFNLGDTTDQDSGEEWQRGHDQMHRLDEYTKWSVVRGNHDSETGFNYTFTAQDMKGNYTGCYQNTMRDSYTAMTIGNLKYLMLSLDMGPSDQELQWADMIMDLYSDYNVIVSTHAYLDLDLSRQTTESGCPATRYDGFNNGVDMWDKCFKKHANIVGIICGHIDADGPLSHVVYGDNGNKIYEFLINPQGLDIKSGVGPTGQVSTFFVSEDGKSVRIETYDTIPGHLDQAKYQYSFSPAVIEATDPVHTYGEWRTVEEATDDHCGHEIRECKLCGHYEVREIEKVEE